MYGCTLCLRCFLCIGITCQPCSQQQHAAAAHPHMPHHSVTWSVLGTGLPDPLDWSFKSKTITTAYNLPISFFPFGAYPKRPFPFASLFPFRLPFPLRASLIATRSYPFLPYQSLSSLFFTCKAAEATAGGPLRIKIAVAHGAPHGATGIDLEHVGRQRDRLALMSLRRPGHVLGTWNVLAHWCV